MEMGRENKVAAVPDHSNLCLLPMKKFLQKLDSGS